MMLAGRAAGTHRGAQQGRELETRRRFVRAGRIADDAAPAVQQFAAINADAGERQSRFALRMQPAFVVEGEVAAWMLHRVVHHHQVYETRRLLRQTREVVIAPDVAVDREEGLVAQPAQRLQHATPGFQRFGAFVRIVQAQAPARTIAERRLETIGEPGDIDHDLGDAGGREFLQMPFDQRFAADRQQRLRRALCQRTHALAFPGREDQGAHGVLRPGGG